MEKKVKINNNSIIPWSLVDARRQKWEQFKAGFSGPLEKIILTKLELLTETFWRF